MQLRGILNFVISKNITTVNLGNFIENFSINFLTDVPNMFDDRNGPNNFGGRNNDNFGGRNNDNFNNRGGGNDNFSRNENIDLLRLLSEQLNRGNDNYGGNRSYGGNSGNKDLHSLLDMDRNFSNNSGPGSGNGGFNNDFGGNGRNNMHMGSGNMNNMGNGRGSNTSQGNDQNGIRVHLRGMPYECDEQDIYDFFLPLMPLNCTIDMNPRTGKSNGEGDAFFATMDDAQKAMSKDRQKMGTRYIELFLRKDNMGGGRGGNFYGN
jgi:heterogeneous nuclear ribonucleoprotein F/H